MARLIGNLSKANDEDEPTILTNDDSRLKSLKACLISFFIWAECF